MNIKAAREAAGVPECDSKDEETKQLNRTIKYQGIIIEDLSDV